MNDDDYPWEYLEGQVHPMDPRLSDILEEREPTPIDRVLVAELAHLYVSRSPAFSAVFCTLSVTWYEQLRWPTVMLALLEQFAQTAIGAQGEERTVKRLAADFLAARDDVIRDAS